jgi:Holliday junction resolvasome RuvABC endonuclease subunit
MRVLGFDVSSTTIGYCALDINEDGYITPAVISYYKPTKEGDIYERLIETKKNIVAIINKYKPTHIGIEDIIQYLGGGSTAQTIILLTSFNRMVGLASYEYLGHSPQMFNIMSIRHGIKHSKQLPPKEDIPKVVAKHLKIKFPYIYKPQKNKSKKKVIASETYDQSDAVACALHYAFILTGKTKKSK